MNVTRRNDVNKAFDNVPILKRNHPLFFKFKTTTTYSTIVNFHIKTEETISQLADLFSRLFFLTGKSQTIIIGLAGETEAGNPEEEPARDNQLHGDILSPLRGADRLPSLFL